MNLEHLRDPVEFVTKLLTHPDGKPCTPHAGQIDVLRGISKTTVLVTGRQWGKSTVLAWYICWFAVTHRYRQIYIIAPSVDQARIIFNEVAYHFRNNPLLKTLVDGKVKDYPFPQIKLLNGCEIHGRGANSEQYIRGKRCHLGVVDEAAFIKSGVLTNIIQPMFTVTGQEDDSALIETSTPFAQGEFYDDYMEGRRRNDSTFRSHNFDSLSNPYADKQRLYETRDRYGEDSLLWRTEYLGLFADSDLAVFNWQDIKWMVDNHTPGDFPAAPAKDHRYTQGVDLANRRDWFVAAVLDVTNPGHMPLVKLDRFQKKTWGKYKDLVRSNHHLYHRARTLLDSTTLGEAVLEELQDIGCEGFAFTGNAVKYDLIQDLARSVNEHRLTIPNKREIIDEFRYFEYKVTPAKVIRMEARTGGTDDVVIAVALANRLANVPQRRTFFVRLEAPGSAALVSTHAGAARDPIADWFSFDNEDD